MTRAETYHLRAQLLELLRDAEHPISSAALARMLPWHTERLDLGCALVCLAPRRSSTLEVVECHGDWHVVRRPRSSQDSGAGIYRHLRSLAREGVVRAISLGPRRVEWEYIRPR